MEHQDQLGRSVLVERTPVRIVSLVPSLTELLVSLGLEDRIVGVTKFCVHPSHIRKSKTIVGGTKTVHYDRIKALTPDLIICNKEENTQEIVETLERDFQVHVSDMYTLADVYELIGQYGALFEVTEAAATIKNAIAEDQEVFVRERAGVLPVRVAYFIWRKPWMVAGGNTFINYLMQQGDFVNVYEETTRYPEITLQSLLEKQVQVVFLSSEPYPFADKHIEEIKKEIGDQIPIMLVDGEYFSWYGSRLLGAFEYFRELHRELPV
ncbi:ABC transporter substrate-binding protein [Aquimarina hainanensis]|uniref:ABC transporter substrate-binding protein n=1 Tax=Aquimarina hainanensis TaxID=1578017 RepID=A0ABW5N511_9FLAO|nr:helical backbone metal receptor [Aquimarina sp. TRL1]QKX05861.1 ABC transporter substrate-binding protein [Aquimarina sp. TRL1]